MNQLDQEKRKVILDRLATKAHRIDWQCYPDQSGTLFAFVGPFTIRVLPDDRIELFKNDEEIEAELNSPELQLKRDTAVRLIRQAFDNRLKDAFYKIMADLDNL